MASFWSDTVSVSSDTTNGEYLTVFISVWVILFAACVAESAKKKLVIEFLQYHLLLFCLFLLYKCFVIYSY